MLSCGCLYKQIKRTGKRALSMPDRLVNIPKLVAVIIFILKSTECQGNGSNLCRFLPFPRPENIHDSSPFIHRFVTQYWQSQFTCPLKVARRSMSLLHGSNGAHCNPNCRVRTQGHAILSRRLGRTAGISSVM